MELRVITEAAAPWRYEVCPYGDTVDLLTVGGIRIKGQWQGKLGEYYMAWMPLPKRDKRKELELGLGLEYLPEGFTLPGVKPKTATKKLHWVWSVSAMLFLLYVAFPAITVFFSATLGVAMSSIVAVNLVGIGIALLVAYQCNR